MTAGQAKPSYVVGLDIGGTSMVAGVIAFPRMRVCRAAYPFLPIPIAARTMD